jgi:hypothetical protein
VRGTTRRLLTVARESSVLLDTALAAGP